MKLTMNRIALIAISVLLMLVAGSCNDINKQESPVSLVVSDTQILHTIDLAGDPTGSTKCQGSIDTIHISTIIVGGNFPPVTNTAVTGADLNQVKIDRYQVSYVRVDGGHLVPAPFVRSTSLIIAAGGTADGTSFVV